MANIKQIQIGADVLNLENYVTATSLATVATTGNYTDLINKPSIPNKTSDLTNDSDFRTGAQVEAAIDAKITSVMRYKGNVATYADLPTTGNVIGDVYNVTDTGFNYAWNGSTWASCRRIWRNIRRSGCARNTRFRRINSSSARMAMSAPASAFPNC